MTTQSCVQALEHMLKPKPRGKVYAQNSCVVETETEGTDACLLASLASLMHPTRGDPVSKNWGGRKLWRLNIGLHMYVHTQECTKHIQQIKSKTFETASKANLFLSWQAFCGWNRKLTTTVVNADSLWHFKQCDSGYSMFETKAISTAFPVTWLAKIRSY